MKKKTKLVSSIFCGLVLRVVRLELIIIIIIIKQPRKKRMVWYGGKESQKHGKQELLTGADIR